MRSEHIIPLFEIEPGDHVADFGSGHGHFAFPLAHRAGSRGKIYAIDVQKRACDSLRAEAERNHLDNIAPLWADLEEARGTGIPSGSLDFVLIANMLFEVQWKMRVANEAERILHEKGRMAIIEWGDERAPHGPPGLLRLSKTAAQSLAAHAGFRLMREFDAGKYHYGLLFSKK